MHHIENNVSSLSLSSTTGESTSSSSVITTTTTTNTTELLSSDTASKEESKSKKSTPHSSSKKKQSSTSSSNTHSDAFIAQQLMKRIKEKKGGVKVVQKKTTTTTVSSSSKDHDYSDTENEPQNEYKKGGYHPVAIGDRLGNDRYVVVYKLGWGYFSTVWLCYDLAEKVFRAVKIQKSQKDFSDAAMDEIKLLKDVMNKFSELYGHPQEQVMTKDATSTIDEAAANGSHSIEKASNISSSMTSIDYSKLRVVGMFDHFLVRGVNGTHVSMVFEVVGQNLLKLIEQYEYKGMPLSLVKIIMRDVLEGLDLLHSHCKIIHTDIKPENILIVKPTNKIQHIMDHYQVPDFDTPLEERDVSTLNKKQLKKLKQKLKHENRLKELQELEEKIATLEKKGSANADHDEHSQALKLLAENAPSESIDVENIRVKIADFGNSIFSDKKVTDDIQTRQYRAPEVIIGARYFSAADIWSAACLAFELATGQYLFDPQSGRTYSRDEDHLALMIELLGPFPHELLSRGSKTTKFFNASKGEMLNIKKFKPTSLKQKLTEGYGMDEWEATELSQFLMPMLEMMPEKRATAKQMLQHPFLKKKKEEEKTHGE
ncbi:hypothetical protein C9374_010807 [Naegleria lovaniensis]|uniref:non-specific serine/threonine protein kinase n=1 Tax=Naegleria lovaniensis TaxID=51637 RepID=A0AA88KDX7_NAELO|nr:uncharacterized protein C9374_010807 [Naegleria lovaniensis]KAG2374523.1 hypothetical protein C9374_010807 [Naegleria lovaniensis]